MTVPRKRLKVYLTDRDDNGRLIGHLIAVDGDHLYDVELPPHLSVVSKDGLTRDGVPEEADE